MKMVMESSSSTATANSTSNPSLNASNMNASQTNSAANNCQSNAQFNPQSLGREFVRQYYTVLNEGPHIMHRFYSDDSSLVHGGSNRQGEPTVYGQADINNKIMSLNFKDCHTKIRQVDSMETVGKGVVIQVIGELSNNGEPMRRFFQTFVLAPRSPSNYYVRNDIFRYQDEVFVDDEEYNEADKNDELDKLDNDPMNHEKTETVVTSIPLKDNVYESVSVNVNGSISHNEISDVEKANESDVDVGSKSDHSPYAVSNEWENTNARRDEPANEMASGSDGNSTPPPQNQNEPLSYASMVNKNFFGPTPFPNSNNNYVPKPNDGSLLTAPFAKTTAETTIAPVTLPPVSSQTTGVVTSTGGGAGKPPVSGHVREMKAGRPRGQQSGKQRNDSREVTPAYGDNDSSAGETNDFASAPRRQQFSDDQQVFVGNLFPDITEEQLKSFFSKFGTILDVRINRANQKSGRTPNYGFVTFDDPSVVKNILNQKPIYFNDHRFNVEEKRSQAVRGVGERSVREGSRSGSGGGGHGSSAGRAVSNNLGNSGNRVLPGNGQRRDRGDRGNQSFGGNDSGRRNGGGGGGPRGGGSSYNRR